MPTTARKFATVLLGGTVERTLVLKDSPGTLYAVYTGLGGQEGFSNPTTDAAYALFDNSATAAGVLVTAQSGYPDGKYLPFELDFTSGLAIKIKSTNSTSGSVTVVFS